MVGHNAAWVGMVVAELPYLLLLSFLYVLIYCASVSLHLKFLLVYHIISHLINLFPLSISGWSIHNYWDVLLFCAFLLSAHGII